MPLTPEASDLPGAGVTSGCEPPERGAGTAGFRRNSGHTRLMSRLSAHFSSFSDGWKTKVTAKTCLPPINNSAMIEKHLIPAFPYYTRIM